MDTIKLKITIHNPIIRDQVESFRDLFVKNTDDLEDMRNFLTILSIMQIEV